LHNRHDSLSRLLKKAHLLRCRASALAAAYLQYASLGLRPAALHLDLFEQPELRLGKSEPDKFGSQEESVESA
jgi:hypothetical protein